MYQGTLEAVSNRADWFIDFELVDDTTGTVLPDLTGITFTFQVRSVPSEGGQNHRPTNYLSDYYGFQGVTYLSAVSGDSHTTTVNGSVEFHFSAAEMKCLPQGSYDVGLTATSVDGVIEQEMIATLPVVDGIIR